jgi:tRNA(adenine34) deaminase
MATHEARMRLALRQAKRAAEAGEVPVGAVIYNGGDLAGQAWNQTRTLKDPPRTRKSSPSPKQRLRRAIGG